jgi:hypothetical protein
MAGFARWQNNNGTKPESFVLSGFCAPPSRRKIAQNGNVLFVMQYQLRNRKSHTIIKMDNIGINRKEESTA